MICLEDCNTFINTKTCKCRLVTHPECLNKWFTESRKCLICKKNLNKIKINIYDCYLEELKNNLLFLTVFHVLEYILRISLCKNLYVRFFLLSIFSIFLSIFVVFPIFLFIHIKFFVLRIKDYNKNIYTIYNI